MSQNYYRKCWICGGKIESKTDSKRFVKAQMPSKILYGHKTEVERKIKRNKDIEAL